jgi:hypothetical protein
MLLRMLVRTAFITTGITSMISAAHWRTSAELALLFKRADDIDGRHGLAAKKNA